MSQAQFVGQPGDVRWMARWKKYREWSSLHFTCFTSFELGKKEKIIQTLDRESVREKKTEIHHVINFFFFPRTPMKIFPIF